MFYIISLSLERFLSYLQKRPFLLRPKVSLLISLFCPMLYSIHFLLCGGLDYYTTVTTLFFLTLGGTLQRQSRQSSCNKTISGTAPEKPLIGADRYEEIIEASAEARGRRGSSVASGRRSVQARILLKDLQTAIN